MDIVVLNMFLTKIKMRIRIKKRKKLFSSFHKMVKISAANSEFKQQQKTKKLTK